MVELRIEQVTVIYFFSYRILTNVLYGDTINKLQVS